MATSFGLLALGLVAGVLSGCLGVGSGLVVVPALVLLFAVPQKAAQGVSLAVMVPMTLVGVISYMASAKIPVDLRVAAIVGLGGVLGAVAGSQLAVMLPVPVLKRVFAVFLILVAAQMLWSARKPARPTGVPAPTPASAASHGGEGSHT
jgi:uncharacterized membrane protein YfcA